MPLLLLLFFLFGLFSGCQWPDDMPTEFSERSRCEVPEVGALVLGERNLNCDVVRDDVLLAHHLYVGMGYPWARLSSLTVRVWNLQVLECEQRILGACVYWLKGEVAFGTRAGSTRQQIELNDGGELLLHEFLHFTDDDDGHARWAVNGKAQLDSLYRGLHHSMRGEDG